MGVSKTDPRVVSLWNMSCSTGGSILSGARERHSVLVAILGIDEVLNNTSVYI